MDQAQQEYPPGTVGYLAQGRGWGKEDAVEADQPRADVDDEANADMPTPANGIQRPPAPEDTFGADDRLSAEDRFSAEHRFSAEDSTFDAADRGPAQGVVPVPEQQTRSRGEPTPTRVRHSDELESLLDAIRVPPNGAGAPPHPVQPAEAQPDVHTDEDDFDGFEVTEPPAPAREEAWPHGWYDELEPDAEPAAEPDAEAAPGYREPVVASWPEPEDPTPPTPTRRPEPEPRTAARWVEPGALAAQQAQRARIGGLAEGDELGSARLLRPGRHRHPRTGWRRAVYVLTGGLINFGESPVELRQRELTTRVNQPLQGCYKIAMLSLKGGVGKTTVTATLGATFASLRGDRVIAVDANPDRGTLSQKIPLETTATVRHLLRDSQRVRRYTDVRAYTSQGPSRLEVLASEQDPAVSEAFSEADYRRTVTLLEHFYNIVLTDCGTGLMHSAMYGVLGVADSLVIVSSGSIDGARSASATMDWLDAHGHRELVSNSVAVINSVRRSSGQVDLDRVAEHFAARCRAVVRIPYDSHLEEGAELDLDRVSAPTRTALLELAAAVADVFPHTNG
ncbi:MAG TPA: AAA family ATPase [Pseudonocardia sp.]|nr:AAA family ATPase [Pseudonocardia sp.]HTF47920.1 AAA family ATPase [Pseudonocardia sp.]